MSDGPATERVLQLLSTPEIEDIGRQLLSRVTAQEAVVSVTAAATAITRFSGNRIRDIEGQQSLQIMLGVDFNGRNARGFSSKTDVASLALLVSETESLAKQNHAPDAQGIELYPPATFADPALYFGSSMEAGDPQFQGEIARQSIASIERAGLMGAGTFHASAVSNSVMNTLGVKAHTKRTAADFSASARSANKGSGWARGGGNDFSRIDPAAVTAYAIDIAKRSENPVAVEPGRYTVILEPEALAQLVAAPIFEDGTQYLSLAAAEEGRSVFSRFEGDAPKGSKMGMQVADRRVQLFCDPMDRLMPFSPLAPGGAIYRRTSWIENGVLKNLAYMRAWGRRHKLDPSYLANPQTGNLEVTGPRQSLQEMITGTKRGIWVHRFAGLSIVSPLTLLLSGVTRDGTFLIENGKVTKAIKNLRFNESPFFFLNRIEAAGEPVRAAGVACPRLKVRDFEFTSLSDAI